jgi:6,7-dimethyl-8-ribityllumazine synthase
MTSSEKSALAPGAIAEAAKRVGTCYVGDSRPGSARVAVVGAKFNGAITERLLGGVLEALESRGIDPESVALAWVPGAFELPLAALRFASSGEVDVVVALGAVIRGDTPHFDFVAGQCAAGCQRVALSSGVPIIFGVLTTDDVEQAVARSGSGMQNRGYQAALSALEMCDLLGKLPANPVQVV